MARYVIQTDTQHGWIDSWSSTDNWWTAIERYEGHRGGAPVRIWDNELFAVVAPDHRDRPRVIEQY